MTPFTGPTTFTSPSNMKCHRSTLALRSLKTYRILSRLLLRLRPMKYWLLSLLLLKFPPRLPYAELLFQQSSGDVAPASNATTLAAKTRRFLVTLSSKGTSEPFTTVAMALSRSPSLAKRKVASTNNQHGPLQDRISSHLISEAPITATPSSRIVQ